MEIALYDGSDGFYATGRGAGRRRDFITSPEVGGLFGAVISRALDAWWDDLDRPDPFVVVEAGAGSGALAASVLASSPRCGPALRYVLVERSVARREELESRIALEDPSGVLGPTAPGTDEAGRSPIPSSGPLATALADLPAEPITGVVLANELVDNIPFRVCERLPGGWAEVRVGEEGGHLVEVLVPAPDEMAEECRSLAPGADVGARIPVQQEGRRWLRRALDSVAQGRVVLIDYAARTAEMADRPDWLRTYRGHDRGVDPLAAVGLQDITAELAIDQLERVRPADVISSQSDFLAEHGVVELADRARSEWEARAHIGDLAALAARSRAGEAGALTDPTGLGAFTVLEWIIR